MRAFIPSKRFFFFFGRVSARRGLGGLHASTWLHPFPSSLFSSVPLLGGICPFFRYVSTPCAISLLDNFFTAIFWSPWFKFVVFLLVCMDYVAACAQTRCRRRAGLLGGEQKVAHDVFSSVIHCSFSSFQVTGIIRPGIDSRVVCPASFRAREDCSREIVLMCPVLSCHVWRVLKGIVCGRPSFVSFLGCSPCRCAFS